MYAGAYSHSTQSHLQLLSHASLTQQPQQALTTANRNTETCSCLVFQIPQRAHTHTLHLYHILLLLLVFYFSPAFFQPFLTLIFLHSNIFIPAWQSGPGCPVFFSTVFTLLPVSFLLPSLPHLHSPSPLLLLLLMFFSAFKRQKVILVT